MNIYYNAKCNLDIPCFWKSIFSILKGLILPISFGIVLKHVFVISSVVSLLAGIVAYVMVYTGSVWLFSLNQYERNLLRKPLSKVMNRK